MDPITASAVPAGISLRSGTRVLTETARPYLAWRYGGETAWREEHAAQLENIQQDVTGIRLTAEFTVARVEIHIAPAGANTWQIGGLLRHKGGRAVELARFHYLDGAPVNAGGFIELQGNGDFPRLVRAGSRLPASRPELERVWNSMHVFWPRMPDPIHDAADWSISTDTGVFALAWDQPGWGFGFTGPGTAFGEIGFHSAGERRFYVGVRLDGILFEAGENRPLENALVWHGDWQDGLRQWALATARDSAVRPVRPSMAGYCSWYQRGQSVEPADILRAVREFSAWPVPPGGRTIQIDDGWQLHPGDWRPNSKFASAWSGLPGIIRNSGSLPGSYLVPTAVHENAELLRQHPDWAQRLASGEPAVHFANWGGKTYFLEPDRPEVKRYMSSLFTHARNEGWGYIKIDFTYAISTARAAYDRKKTLFQSYRALYETFREGAGRDMLLSACVGEPGRYALGLVDVARLGGDTGAEWKTVQGNLARLLTLTATNGVWWQGDPDVFYMRAEKSKLSEEESYLLTGTLGLFGGLFLTSDWPSQWTGDRAEAVREFWTSTGIRRPSEHRVLWNADGVPLAYRVSYGSQDAPRHRVALYNWSGEPADVSVRLRDVGLNGAYRLSATGRSKTLRMEKGVILSPTQPPHSLRIARLED